MAPLSAAGEAVGRVGLELSGAADLESALRGGSVMGGAIAVAGMLPIGEGGRLAKGIAKTIAHSQGAEVAVDRIGKFTRAIWEVAGNKGAGYVRYNKIFSEEGKTMRMYKDVYGQGGDFIRRDWYVGGPPK
ncbi:MAG: hypothetical protein ABJB66_06235 [Gemmatimonadaceae bacterium]